MVLQCCFKQFWLFPCRLEDQLLDGRERHLIGLRAFRHVDLHTEHVADNLAPITWLAARPAASPSSIRITCSKCSVRTLSWFAERADPIKATTPRKTRLMDPQAIKITLHYDDRFAARWPPHGGY